MEILDNPSIDGKVLEKSASSRTISTRPTQKLTSK
jgi:hypothetical protein